MQKQKQQDEEISLTNAYSLFVYAIRTQITRDYYLRRLRTFFDFIKILPNAKIERRCNHFAALAIKDHDWTFSKIIGFLQFQKERVQREEVTAATLYNFVKALKLFCEMSDVPVSWKKITRGLPKVRSFANDRAPTMEEIRKMTEYPDRRMKAIDLLTINEESTLRNKVKVLEVEKSRLDRLESSIKQLEGRYRKG